MSSARTWLYRFLTLGGAGMFLASWLMPWWTAYIVYLKSAAVNLRPWGVDMLLSAEYASWIPSYEMPAIFAPLMWAYLGLCMAALLISMFAPSAMRVGLGKLKLSLPTALVLGVGISYIVCVIVAALVMQMRLKEFFDAPLIGSVFFRMGEVGTAVNTNFLPGYWLACATGPVLVVLATLRQFIIGRAKA